MNEDNIVIPHLFSVVFWPLCTSFDPPSPLSLSADFSGVNKFSFGSIGVVSCPKGVMSLVVKFS